MDLVEMGGLKDWVLTGGGFPRQLWGASAAWRLA